MESRKLVKRLGVSILTLALGSILPNQAQAGTVCGHGKVVEVGIRWPEAPVTDLTALLSIGILHTDDQHPAGTTIYYSSQGTANLDGSPWLRSILQLATLAMTTGSDVYVSTDNSNCTTFTDHNKEWVNNLGALWLVGR